MWRLLDRWLGPAIVAVMVAIIMIGASATMPAQTPPDQDAVFDEITLALVKHQRNIAQTVCRCGQWREGQQDPSRGVDGVAATVTWTEHLARVAQQALDDAGWALIQKKHAAMPTAAETAIEQVVEFVEGYSYLGKKHKGWMIDQIMRRLLGDGYEEWREVFTEGTNEWDQGVAP